MVKGTWSSYVIVLPETSKTMPSDPQKKFTISINKNKNRNSDLYLIKWGHTWNGKTQLPGHHLFQNCTLTILGLMVLLVIVLIGYSPHWDGVQWSLRGVVIYYFLWQSISEKRWSMSWLTTTWRNWTSDTRGVYPVGVEAYVYRPWGYVVSVNSVFALLACSCTYLQVFRDIFFVFYILLQLD